MRKSIFALALGSTAMLGACASNPAVTRDAVIGAAVGGLAGAVWADRNNDGVVDGYVYNGQYYAGAPAGSATTTTTTTVAPPPAPMRSGERG